MVYVKTTSEQKMRLQYRQTHNAHKLRQRLIRGSKSDRQNDMKRLIFNTHDTLSSSNSC